MSREARITRELQQHDAKLFCKRHENGCLAVYRESDAFECYEIDGKKLLYSRRNPWFIFALTHDWKSTGRSVDWGILPIMKKIRMSDSHHHDLAQFSISSIEKTNKSQDRDVVNQHESFARYELRDAMKREFKDTLTHSLPKIDQRYAGDKSIKN